MVWARKRNEWTRSGRSFTGDTATFVGHLLSLMLPLAMLQIFDRVIPNQGVATLVVLGLALLGAAIAEIALRGAAAAIQSGLTAKREIERTTRLLHNTLYARHRLSDEPNPVETRAHFETIERMRALEGGDLRSSRFDLPFAIAFVGAFAIIAPSLVWALALALALVILPNRNVDVLRKRQDELIERTKRLHDFLGQTLAGIESVKGIRAESFLQRRFESLYAGIARLNGKIARLRGVSRARIDLANHSIPSFMAVAGAWSVASGEMSAGTLAAAILLSGRAVQPLIRALSARDMRQGLAPAATRLETALAAPALTGGDLELPPLERLEARNILVRDANGTVRLENVNACLVRGEALAVTGASGSGKSLLLRVLSGLLVPDAGEVLWNDTPLDRFDAKTLSQRVVTLRDAPRLPATTVFDYLADGRPDKSRAAMRAIVQLGLGEELAALPEGLSSRLGASGSGLLPSLEARLPIARALASNPDLLLFDSANNGLDSRADSKVLQALQSRGRDMTLVIASARPSYLRLAAETICLAGHGTTRPVQGLEGAA